MIDPSCHVLGRVGQSVAVLLLQGASDGLGHATFHLASALLGVHHGAGVGGLDRLQDADLAGPDVDSDPERLHVERERAQFAELAAVGGQPGTVPVLGGAGGSDLGETQRPPTGPHTVPFQCTLLGGESGSLLSGRVSCGRAARSAAE